MTAKAKPTDTTDGPPCPAAVLRERGRLMTAVEAEKRAGGVK